MKCVNDPAQRASVHRPTALYLLRALMCAAGSALVAAAMVVMAKNRLGSDPMTMLVEGVSGSFGISLGLASVLLNVCYLVLGLVFARRKIGFGTATTVFLTGILVDRFSGISFAPGSAAAALLALLLYCAGIALTVSSQLGMGACEAFLIGFCERSGLPYRFAKMLSDLLFFLAALRLKAAFGWGTILCILFTGPGVELLCRVLRGVPAARGGKSMQEERNMKEKKKLIFDVDTGSDDAMAVMLAQMSGAFDVVAMCSVNGNHALEFTTENTLRLAQFLHMDCPVYRGCAYPMVSTLLPWRRPGIPSYETYPMDAHGLYLDLPAADKKKIEEISAAEFYVDYLRHAQQPVTIVAVGPLSNLGLALRIDPDIAKNIAEIVIMGGGYHEFNCDPGTAEWNIWIDPEAASIVFQCGAPITLMPLDATHMALVTKEESALLMQRGSPVAKAAAEMIDRRIIGYNNGQPMSLPDSAPIHDALCVAYLLDESVITEFRSYYMEVSISPDASDGATFAADNAIEAKRNNKPNIKLALACDREKFVNMLFDAYSKTVE